VFLRTRLHVYLLWSTCIFAFLAVMSSLLTDGGTSQSADNGGGKQTTSTSAVTTTTGPIRYYTVQPGESLFAIAQKFNLSAPRLVELNKIKNPDRVPAGTQLMLPPSNGFVPIGATTTMAP
jgi:LysM repeat protein